MPPKTIEKQPLPARKTGWPGPKSVRLFKEEQKYIAPGIQSQYMDEVIAGFEDEILDDLKVGVQIDQATGLLWQAGCLGPDVTKGFLDFSNVEPGHPTWVKYTQGWVARARRGVGIRGGPKNTPTAAANLGGRGSSNARGGPSRGLITSPYSRRKGPQRGPNAAPRNSTTAKIGTTAWTPRTNPPSSPTVSTAWLNRGPLGSIGRGELGMSTV